MNICREWPDLDLQLDSPLKFATELHMKLLIVQSWEIQQTGDQFFGFVLIVKN